MMRRIQKAFAVLLCLLVLLSTLILPAQAAGELNSSQKVRLTVCHIYDEKPLKNVAIKIYRVANMNADGVLEARSAYKSLLEEALRTDDTSVWEEAAEMLEDKVPWSNVASVTTDKNGKAVFENLTPGLYLIKSTRKATSTYIYSSSAALVTLPQKTEDGWNYSATVYTKNSVEPAIKDIKVVKVWEDSCHPERRPKSITINLLCDGELYDTVTLPYRGKWEYTWKDRDADHDWTVEEERVTGYKNPVVKVKNGIITVTNTCNRPGKHYNSRIPQTGQLWWPVPVLMALGLLLLIIGLIRRREDRYED